MNNGRLRTVLTTDPGSGGDISQVVPAGEVWQILSITFQLVTSSNIGTRLVLVNFTDGTRNILQSSGVTQDEGRSIGYQLASLAGDGGPFGYIPIPPLWILYPGYTFATIIAFRLSGDNFGPATINFLQT